MSDVKTNQPVLIVIDMLKDFLDSWPPAKRAKLVSSIKELIGIMRNYKCPVIWVRQEFKPDLSDAFGEMKKKKISITIEGTPGCEIIPELRPETDEPVIIKKQYSPFFKTNLDQVLASLNPRAVILAGINTHACVRTAAIDAYQWDWPTVIAVECVASNDEEHHRITLQYLKDKIAEVLTNTEIKNRLMKGA